MRIEGQATFSAPQHAVWEALLDPSVMAACVPGCRELREIEADRYAVLLKIGVGAVSGTYEGNLQINDKTPPSGYRMSFEGAGAQGFVRGTGGVQLHGENGVTVVQYQCDVEVGGLIASVGNRMLSGVGKFLVNQMFSKLKSQVGNGAVQ